MRFAGSQLTIWMSPATWILCGVVLCSGCSGGSTGTTTPTSKAPIANAGGPYTALPGAVVAFSGFASTDPQGSVLTYAWNFGDSTTGSGVSPSHSYAAVGSYTISLTATDALGLSATATTTVTVAAQSPVSNAGGPYTTSVGSPVTFNGTGSSDPQAQPLTYAWDFGDGTTGTGVQPSHFYTTHGSYTATLTVTDATYNVTGKATASVTNMQVAIQPMTNVVVGASGYFSDPYPIQTTVSNGSPVPSFVGTTKQILTCASALQPACFTSAPNTVVAGTLAAQATAAGSTITGFENLNSYQDSKGNWQMAVTALVTGSNNKNWSVIVHASPQTPFTGIPTAWSADALLVGSFGMYESDNYDGKYFEDGGVLYLLYNKKLNPVGTTLEEGIVAQAMLSASVPAGSATVTLLGPENTNGGYDSEVSAVTSTNTVKLVETGNVTRIQGKYVMAYSTGYYDMPNYKAGVAWSDSFLPTTPGTYYTRVQKIDTAGVWGVANHAEVAYLLQAQQPQWPNYVAAEVLAPGVPSIVADASGNYHLFFAGYDPSDAALTSANAYPGARRRPYYVDLKVNIPGGASVSSSSPIDMASWLLPVTRP